MSITDLADGQQVARTGAYRCSMDWYHTQGICPGPSISSTGLRAIQLQSPWHFWSQCDLNPDRYPEKDLGDGLILGKAAHCLILGDEVFDDTFIYLPANAPRKPTPQQCEAYDHHKGMGDNFFIIPKGAPRRPTESQIEQVKRGEGSDAAKRSVEFWDPVISWGKVPISQADMELQEERAKSVEFWREFEQRAAGRLMLTEAQVETIKYIADNLQRCPEAVAALTGGLVEVSMIWEDPITGVWLKARPDMIPDNGADFGDLKTFAPRSKSIERAAHQAITDHGYAMQMALAVMGAEQVFGTTAKDCDLIMAQTSAPYTITPVRLDEEALIVGKDMCRKAIDTFARCMETMEWPMPVTGLLKYSMPPSMIERFYNPEGI